MQESSINASPVKRLAMQVIDNLPGNATWHDPQHALYIAHKFERGMLDYKNGKYISHDDVKRKLNSHV